MPSTISGQNTGIRRIATGANGQPQMHQGEDENEPAQEARRPAAATFPALPTVLVPRLCWRLAQPSRMRPVERETGAVPGRQRPVEQCGGEPEALRQGRSDQCRAQIAALIGAEQQGRAQQQHGCRRCHRAHQPAMAAVDRNDQPHDGQRCEEAERPLDQTLHRRPSS